MLPVMRVYNPRPTPQVLDAAGHQLGPREWSTGDVDPGDTVTLGQVDAGNLVVVPDEAPPAPDVAAQPDIPVVAPADVVPSDDPVPNAAGDTPDDDDTDDDVPPVPAGSVDLDAEPEPLTADEVAGMHVTDLVTYLDEHPRQRAHVRALERHGKARKTIVTYEPKDD